MKYLTFFLIIAITYGRNCENDDDCGFNQECDTTSQICKHINLIPVVTNQALEGWIWVMVLVGLSTVGGIGGGVEKIPIFILWLNYSEAEATQLTYATMLGAAITNFALLFKQRDYQLDKPVIDYDIALILTPTIIFGADLGVSLADKWNEIVTTTIVVVIMTLLVPFMVLKGNVYRHREERSKIISQLLEAIPDCELETIQRARTFSQVSVLTQTDRDIFLKYKKLDTEFVPKKTFSYIVIIFVLLNGLAVIRGGDEFGSIIGIPNNSVGIFQFNTQGYWVFSSIILIAVLVISYLIKKHLEEKQEEMQGVGYLERRGDLVYNWKNFSQIWLIGFISSFMGGLTGLGSGSVMVPLLILSKVGPRTSAATAGFVKLQIASSATILALLNNNLNYSDMLFFGSLGFLGTFFITFVLYQALNEGGYEYPFILIVLAFIVLNAFGAALVLIVKV